MTSADSRRPNFKFNYETVVLYLHVYNFVGISYSILQVLNFCLNLILQIQGIQIQLQIQIQIQFYKFNISTHKI